MDAIDDVTLQRIIHQIIGPVSGLFVPKIENVAERKIGARFVIAPSRRELPGGPAPVSEFLETLKRVPMPHGVSGLAHINLIVSKSGYLDPIHKDLNTRFLTQDRKIQLRQFVKDHPPLPDAIHIFNRVGVLLLQRLAFAVSSLGTGSESEPAQLMGEIALLANDYVIGGAFRRAEKQTQVDYTTILVEALPTWDISNAPDLAYGLTRAYRLLTVYLLGDDPGVVGLREKLKVDFSQATFDGLLLDEYVACVFGLYAWYESLDPRKIISGEQTGVIKTSVFVARTRFAKAKFDGFVQARSRTIDEFRGLVSNTPLDNTEALEKSLTSDAFIADTIAFRRFPLCRVADDRLVCLDTRFLSELLISGLYWQVLGSLSKGAGDIFLSLWGRLFELYLGDQLTHHYPQSLMSPLRLDVGYSGGQVDALLDFGDDVILFEFKGSLLKVQAKYNRDVQAFKEEFVLKFVENEEGSPKALRQLATACIASVDGTLKTSMPPRRVFPVVVGYEMSLDGFWVNRFADDIFRDDLLPKGLRPRVRPLTVMSVESFEIAIAYTSQGDITWPNLLERRFFDDKVVDFSVSQLIYDWRTQEEVEIRRNEFILKDFERIFEKAIAQFREDPSELHG